MTGALKDQISAIPSHSLFPMTTNAQEAAVPPKKVPLFIVAVLVTVSALASFVLGVINPFGKPSIPHAISMCYVESNRTLPRMVDEHTRLEAICPDTLDGRTVIYKNTVIGIDLSKLDMDKLKASMLSNMTRSYRTGNGMEAFRRHSMTVKYQYFDLEGAKIMEFTIDPKTF